MNVFVLSTGRCGTETFARACAHMTNYTVAHESHNRWLFPCLGMPYADLRYPDGHIEVDNRLSWFLGRLERTYGGDAFYVHLLRDREEVARSVARRGRNSILYSFASGILQLYDEAHDLSETERLEVARHYWNSVNDNIRAFLRNKPRQQTILLHNARTEFPEFWRAIGAEGELEAALAEWTVRHNASKSLPSQAEWPDSSRPLAVQRAIAVVSAQIPSECAYVLIDDDTWSLSRASGGRRRLLFGEVHGTYAGPPANDEICQERLRDVWDGGARFLILATACLWWLEQYPSFAQYLHHDCEVLEERKEYQLFRLSDPHQSTRICTEFMRAINTLVAN